MATNVVIPEGFRIVNQTPQIPEGFRVVSNETTQINLTPEQKAKIQAAKDEYARRQAERDKDQWFVSLVENKQDDPLKNIARSTARLGLSAMQGIANAGLNPFTDVAEEMGADLKPIKPENMAERTAELAGQYGYDAAALYAMAKGAGDLYPTLAPVTAPIVAGGLPLALGQSSGSAFLTGMVNPESTVGRFLTDLVGGGLASGITKPRISAPKQDVRAVKELTQAVDGDILARDMAEAERTGRSVLEVGGDEVVQAAQKAKLQTPEARSVLSDYITQATEAQPARTESVINEALGTQGKNATIAQVKENAKTQAQPLYDKAAENIKNASKDDLKELENVVENNGVISDAVNSVKRSNSALKDEAITNPKVILRAREKLSANTKSLDHNVSFDSIEALKELDPILGKVTDGKLFEANKIYKDAHQFEKASDLGRDVFNQRTSPSDLKVAWDSLSSTEKQAARIGLREEIMNKIGSYVNQTNALNKFLPKNVREKIMTIAGENEGAKIIDEAEQAVKLRNNLNKVLSGSQTAEKQSLRDALKGIRGFIRNPWDTTVDYLAKPFDTQRNIRMAEYLTNPNIKQAFANVAQAERLNALRPRAKSQSAIRSTIERLTEENN